MLRAGQRIFTTDVCSGAVTERCSHCAGTGGVEGLPGPLAQKSPEMRLDVLGLIVLLTAQALAGLRVILGVRSQSLNPYNPRDQT